MCSFSVTVHGLVSVELSLTPPCSLFIRPVNSMLVVEFWHAVCTVVSVQSSYWDVVHLWTCLSTQRREEKHLHRKIIHTLKLLPRCCCSFCFSRLKAASRVVYWLLIIIQTGELLYDTDSKHLFGLSDIDLINCTLTVTLCQRRRSQTVDVLCTEALSQSCDIWRPCCSSCWCWRSGLCQAVLLNFSKMMPTVCKLCSLVGCRPLLEKRGH